MLLPSNTTLSGRALSNLPLCVINKLFISYLRFHTTLTLFYRALGVRSKNKTCFNKLKFSRQRFLKNLCWPDFAALSIWAARPFPTCGGKRKQIRPLCLLLGTETAHDSRNNSAWLSQQKYIRFGLLRRETASFASFCPLLVVELQPLCAMTLGGWGLQEV